MTDDGVGRRGVPPVASAALQASAPLPVTSAAPPAISAPRTPAPAAAPAERDYLEAQQDRFRAVNRSQVLTALGVSLAALATNVVYFVATADQPNRGHLWALQAIATAVGLVATRPPRRLRRTRVLRSIVLHGWASSQFVIIGLAAALDGGLTSPMILLLFFPLTVAAMGFEPRSVWLHVGTTVATVFTVGGLTATLTLGHGLMWSSALGTTGVVGASIARRQRGLARELVRANEELSRLARTDPLTGCLNHRSFHDELEAALERRDRDGRPLVVLLLDIDDFKHVNDTHGHPIGDEVLITVARALVANVRASDLVARTGGEEFAVLLPDTPVAEAQLIAERLRRSVSAASHPVTVTASAGLAAVPDHAATGAEVIRIADRAMYDAKDRGRDQLVVAVA